MINRHWIWLMSWDITTTQDFFVFLHLLRMYLDKTFDWKRCRIMIVLYNASIHWTTTAKSTKKSYNINIIVLSQYCPHLALIEFVFGMVKGHSKHQSSDEVIDYKKGSGKKAIIVGLERLTPAKVVNMWLKIIKITKKSIVKAYTKSSNLLQVVYIKWNKK